MLSSDSAQEALEGVLRDDMTIAVGGFGLCGIPSALIAAVRDSGIQNLTIISNNMGIDGKGLGLLLENEQVTKVVSSYVGENKLFAQQYLDGSLHVEFNPQGTLAERMRAGGAGIAAFYTPTGVGTVVAEGKPTAVFDHREYVLERAIVADLSLVHAYQGDRNGNLRYRRAARNFNPVVAACGRVTIAEVEYLVDAIDPDDVHTPNANVSRMIVVSGQTKHIEQLTTRGPRPEAAA